MNHCAETSTLDCGSAGVSPSRMASSALSVRIEPWSETVWAEWRGLERRVADVPLAACSNWTAAWLHAYRDTVDARVVIAEQEGRVCGIALLANSRQQQAGPCRLTTTHLGTAGEADGESACVEYNGLLAEEGVRSAFASRLVDLARADRSIDEVRLDGFQESTGHELLSALPGAAVTTRVSRYFDLEAARSRKQNVIEALGRSTRSALRRALRKTGDVEVTQARSLDDADDILSELIELHQARWQASGQPGAFAGRRFTAFQRELITRLLPDEKVVLVRVRNRTLTIGCLMLLVDRERLLDYVSGFAAFDQTPSPGIVTHYLAMEQALAQGYRAYDFLVGDKRHKANLATDSTNLVWAAWRRPNWKNRTISGLRSVKRAAAGLRRRVRQLESGEGGR